METTKMNTGKARFSYLYATEPQAPMKGNDKGKYSVQLLIPKTDTTTVKLLNSCMKAAVVNDRETDNKLKGVKSPKLPLHDGDGEKPNGGEYDDICHGHYVLSASSYNKPGLVDINNDLLPEPSEWYSGIYGRANINFYAYNTNGNKGIACGLNHLQKISDGESLSGAGSATSAFDDEYRDPDSAIEGDFDPMSMV